MKGNSDLSEGLPKTLVLFLHTITVPEATGEKMAPKPETIVLQGMYITYPYLESHKDRLPSPIRLLKYPINTKIHR
jgi:hypothetical protein